MPQKKGERSVFSHFFVKGNDVFFSTGATGAHPPKVLVQPGIFGPHPCIFKRALHPVRGRNAYCASVEIFFAVSVIKWHPAPVGLPSSPRAIFYAAF